MRTAIVVAVAFVLAACAPRQDTPVLYEVTPQAAHTPVVSGL
jgi:hypothetical protein